MSNLFEKKRTGCTTDFEGNMQRKLSAAMDELVTEMYGDSDMMSKDKISNTKHTIQRMLEKYHSECGRIHLSGSDFGNVNAAYDTLYRERIEKFKSDKDSGINKEGEE